METANVWKHLKNIWVLAGLVLVVFTSLLKLLPVDVLDSPAIERLMDKGIDYLFILGLVCIVLGFVISRNKISQTISKNTGTAINAVGDVNINQPSSTTSDRTQSIHPTSLNQQIKDNDGKAINAGGNVSIKDE